MVVEVLAGGQVPLARGGLEPEPEPEPEPEEPPLLPELWLGEELMPLPMVEAPLPEPPLPPPMAPDVVGTMTSYWVVCTVTVE